MREEQKAYHLQGAIEDILDDPNAVDLDEDGEEQALHPCPSDTCKYAKTRMMPCLVLLQNLFVRQGFEMYDAGRASGAEVSKSRWTSLRSHHVLSPAHTVAALDLKTVTVEEINAIQSSFELEVAGQPDSITCWFDVHFRAGGSPSTLTTSPGVEALDTHWGQQTLPLHALLASDGSSQAAEATAEKQVLRGELEIFRVEGSQRMYDAKVGRWECGASQGGAVYYVVA